MRISDWSSDVCSSDLDNPQEHSQRQGRKKWARDLAGKYALGLFLDHVDHHFDKGLEAARNARIGQLCSAPHQENDHKTCKDGPEQGVVVDEAEIGDGRLLGTDVIQVNQVMLNILRLWRNITSSHLNPYPVDERAKPMKLTHKKTMAVCGTSATAHSLLKHISSQRA